jgi:hypothetical protein
MQGIKQFNPEIAKDYKLFFIFDKIKASDDSLTVEYKMQSKNEVIEDYDLFEMNNNYLLIAFKDSYPHFGKYNYIASNGLIEEIINLQSFEKIYEYYNVDIDNVDKGYFFWLNSNTVNVQGQDWRCDNQKYGPVQFILENTEYTTVFNELSRIKTYEPILNLNGIGHIVYLHLSDDEILRDEFANKSVLPFTGVTLQEVIKLLLEWSYVSNDPFNNSQDISIKAKEFIELIGLTEDLVSNQPDMYVFEYLKGNTNARQRPNGVEPMLPVLKEFIKRNSSYMSLSALLAVYPEAWDFEDVLEIEKTYLQDELNFIYSITDNNITNLIRDNFDLDEVFNIVKEYDFNYAIRVRHLLNIFIAKKTIIQKVDELRNGSF